MIDEPGYTNDLKCYLKHGGYEVMKKAFTRPPRS
jgi:NADH-quinone oxidoreductase subunit F